MAPATELATLPLSSGATIEDANSPAGKVWQSTLDTVSTQEGFQRAYYGREVENPSVLQLFIDWDSYEAHKTFTKTPVYKPFEKHLTTILDGTVIMRHANFDPHPPSAALSANSPVTEVLTAYFTSKDDSFDEKAKKFVGILQEKAEGFKGASGGWVMEDVEHEKIGEGKKGKAFVAVLGWESVDAHMRVRETDAFTENIHLLREGPVAMEVHHTTFNEK